MEKVYVSIDMDYWCSPRQSRKEGTDYIANVIDLCPTNVKCVIMHHQLLRHINKSGASAVYNIDFHSDLADRVPKHELNEGTWANFVKFKKNGKFIWFYPFSHCYLSQGRCDSLENPFDDPINIAGWEQAEHRLHKPSLSWLQSKEIVGVGICVSPHWISEDLAMPMVDLLHDKGHIVKAKVKSAYNKAMFLGVR